jgi:hypothetical protein
LGDAEMAILMDERFMRGFLHEFWQSRAEDQEGSVTGCFDQEGWAAVFPGLQVCPSSCSKPPQQVAAAIASPPPRPPRLASASPEGSLASAGSSDRSQEALGGRRFVDCPRSGPGSIGDSDGRRSSGSSSRSGKGWEKRLERPAPTAPKKHMLRSPLPSQPSSEAAASSPELEAIRLRPCSPMRVPLPAAAMSVAGVSSEILAESQAPPGLGPPCVAESWFTFPMWSGSHPLMDGWQPLLQAALMGHEAADAGGLPPRPGPLPTAPGLQHSSS